MTYVLVSLVGDEATGESNALSKTLEELRSPSSVHRGESPNVDEVRQSMSGVESAVLFGHDKYGTLRAFSDPTRSWANGEQIGRMFHGARIYLFACSSFLPEGESLAEKAVQHGVRLVVGHDAPVSSPDSDLGYSRTQISVVRKAALSMIEAFLDGETDHGRLKETGMRAWSVLEQGHPLDLGLDGSPLINAAIVLHKLPESIRVLSATTLR